MNPINLTIQCLLIITLLSLTINASATTNCSANASDLAFGNISMGSTQNNTATITVNCNTSGLFVMANTRVHICLNIGAGNSLGSTINDRNMSNVSLDQLQFQIYRDASRSQIWGEGITEDVDVDLEYAVPIVGGSGMASVTMYGQVPAQFGLASGDYQNQYIGSHTRLDYRYAEALSGFPNWPATCTSGGDGGGSITFPFTANATVPASCVIDIVNNLNFGTVPGLISSNHDQTSSFSFTCTNTTPLKVSLDDGLHVTGSTRRMRLGATSNYVQYELYSDSARTQRWGNTIDTDTVNSTGTGSSQNLTVYGRVPAPQSLPSGDYSDTVTVTITY
jgi:spore coat protein U-like protein